ncbi:MAG TPA: HAD-IIIA family hydrolase, partial [Ktedonobacteraceae bacterium]|nr:HAD-IIIA family hydrolase [Ktedonobacteraceae bacterium]
MHAHLRAELQLLGVELAGIYACPHHPQGVVAELARPCECRKPRPGLLLQAANEHNLDLAHSWFVGDILDDVEAGERAGCRTILVDLGTEAWPEHAMRQPDFVARTTLHALQMIQALEGGHGDVDLTYLPASWQHADVQQAGVHYE